MFDNFDSVVAEASKLESKIIKENSRVERERLAKESYDNVLEEQEIMRLRLELEILDEEY